MPGVDRDELTRAYLAYVACLNARDLDRLEEHVAEDVRHNGRHLGLDGYRAMLEGDIAAIPDLRFDVGTLAVGEGVVAARLAFDCTPVGDIFGVRVHGRRVAFHEHVFYTYVDGRIADVRSLVDVEALRRQAQDDRVVGEA